MTKRLSSQKGQALIEVGLLVPFLLLLTLGTIEVANLVDTHMVMGHLTREGANMSFRGMEVDEPGKDNDVLDALVASSQNILAGAVWRIYHSRIGSPGDPDNPNNCIGNTDTYVILEQSTRGSKSAVSQLGQVCGAAILTSLDSVAPGLSLHAVEIFYDYETITGVQQFGVSITPQLYERSIF
jgi:hypothetical protein